MEVSFSFWIQSQNFHLVNVMLSNYCTNVHNFKHILCPHQLLQISYLCIVLFNLLHIQENPLDMVKDAENTLNPQSVMIGVADDDGSCFTDAIPGKKDTLALFVWPLANNECVHACLKCVYMGIFLVLPTWIRFYKWQYSMVFLTHNFSLMLLFETRAHRLLLSIILEIRLEFVGTRSFSIMTLSKENAQV